MKHDDSSNRIITQLWRAKVYIEHPAFRHIVEPSIYMGEGVYNMDLGTPLKNFQHERFAMGIVKGLNHTQAAIYAGYKETRAMQTGGELVRLSDIVKRIKRLNELTHSPGIMGVKERKEKLSDIARPCLTDFVEAGESGSHIEVGKDSPGKAAIQEVTTRTERGLDGTLPAVVTKLKLHDPVRAIAELNRMEGEHAPAEMRHTGVDGGPVILRVVYDGDEEKGKEPEKEAGEEDG